MAVTWPLGADELRDHQIHTVNMLGCHDGIPLLDLKGLLPEERIQSLIGTIVARGGMVKDLARAEKYLLPGQRYLLQRPRC